MTREEAIKSLQNIIEYWTYKPTEVETAKMAISALRPITREQVEKVWRGEWEDHSDKHDRGMDLFCSICHNRASRFVGGTDDWWDFQKPNFCPNCGALMTDEAVEMVMERLEVLKDADADH